MLYQYGNEANARAHYETTGPEILADLPEITHFVAGLGHDGHADGNRALPARARAWRADRGRRAAVRRAGLRAAEHGRGVRPRALRRHGADLAVLGVGRRRAAPDPGAGFAARASSPGSRPGCAVHAGLALAGRAQEAGERADIVVLVADGGWKYLSTGAYSGTLAEAEARLEGELWA